MTETSASAAAALEPEDRGLLIGLLYRAGIWMSHADDEEGELDDKRELQALERTLKMMTDDESIAPFVRDLVAETLKRRDHWPQWEAHSFDILGDCRKADAVLSGSVSESDGKAYKKALVNIAETVAAAHGEFGMIDKTRDDNLWGRFFESIRDKLSGDEEQKGFLNISPAEQSALERLSEALKTKHH